MAARLRLGLDAFVAAGPAQPRLIMPGRRRAAQKTGFRGLAPGR